MRERSERIGWGGVRLRCGRGTWRTERARAARAAGESLSRLYPEARAKRAPTDILLSDRERPEGFRRVRGGYCIPVHDRTESVREPGDG
jgi:hypothetical protein